MSDKPFAEGFFAEHKDINGSNGVFRITKIGVKVDEAIAYLQKHRNEAGYVNLDLKTGKSGNAYVELNTYQKPSTAQSEAPQWAGREQARQAVQGADSGDVDLSEIPF